MKIALMLLILAGSRIAWSEPAQPAKTEPTEVYDGSNRLALGLLFGLGSADLGRVHDLGNDSIMRSGLSGEAPSGTLTMSVEFSLRYCFAYHVMAQIGYGTLYNHGSSEVSQGAATATLKTYNLIMEVPLLLGGHMIFKQRITGFAALGPSFYFFPRSFWDIESAGGAPDFKTGGGVGFAALLGGEFLITKNFSAGLELRYRSLSASELKEKNTGVVVRDTDNQTYSLDFSGLSAALTARMFFN